MYHPNAYIKEKRNTKRGLSVRTCILETIEKKAKTARELASECEISYYSCIYHLKVLKSEKIVERSDKRPYKWKITGCGQRRLNFYTTR